MRQADIKNTLTLGGVVVIQGAREADVESILGIKIPVRLYKNISFDKKSHTPLNTAAIGVTKNRQGGYHLIAYVGPVTEDRVKNDLTEIYTHAGHKPGEISLATISNTPCYTCTTGQVNYDYQPYGQIISTWSLVRSIVGAEHIWEVHFTDNISPGRTLRGTTPTYGNWSTNYYRPRVSVNYYGQELRDADPQSVSSDGTFSVNLGYMTAYASWSWTIPAVGVTESCDWMQSKTCRWEFNYRWFSNAGNNSSKQQPGVMTTNTAGNFMIYHEHSTEWVGLYTVCCYATSTDAYTLSVSDF